MTRSSIGGDSEILSSRTTSDWQQAEARPVAASGGHMQSAALDGRSRRPAWRMSPEVASRQIVVVVAAFAAVAVSALLLLAVFGGDDAKAPASGSSSSVPPTADSTPVQTVAAPSAALKVRLPAQGRIGMGNEGANVTLLQRALVAVGLDPGARDGIFGRKTQVAVITFQRQHNLSEDGVVGAKTAAALNAALVKASR